MKDFSLKTHSKRSGVISNLFRTLTLSLFALCTTLVFAQQKTIKGIVVDATGEPLIGVNVSVKGTTIGIITDIDGKYTLEVPTNATLVFSYIERKNILLEIKLQSTLPCKKILKILMKLSLSGMVFRKKKPLPVPSLH